MIIKNVGRFGNTTCARIFDGSHIGICTNVIVRIKRRFNGKYISGDDFNSRANFGVHTKNYCGIHCNFNFRTLDAQLDDRIFHRYFCKRADENKLNDRD